MDSVSYTHLDVYKRQAKEMTEDLKINQILGNGIEYLLQKNDHQKLITNLSKQIKNYVLENHEMVRAVSYTHLDVYKRQELISNMIFLPKLFCDFPQEKVLELRMFLLKIKAFLLQIEQ